MIQCLLTVIVCLALWVVFHAWINPWVVRAWERFRHWRNNSTRQL